MYRYGYYYMYNINFTQEDIQFLVLIKCGVQSLPKELKWKQNHIPCEL